MQANQINDLRARVLAGETVSPEELREALATLRNGRRTAATQSASSKRKKTPKTPEAAQAELDSLLGGFGL